MKVELLPGGKIRIRGVQADSLIDALDSAHERLDDVDVEWHHVNKQEDGWIVRGVILDPVQS